MRARADANPVQDIRSAEKSFSHRHVYIPIWDNPIQDLTSEALALISRRDRRYKDIARRLREAREAAGLTQQAAAARLGVPQSFISKCESGERRLDVLELDALARLYGRSSSDLV